MFFREEQSEPRDRMALATGYVRSALLHSHPPERPLGFRATRFEQPPLKAKDVNSVPNAHGD